MATKKTAAKKAPKKRARVAPCEKCRGHTVPGRTVASVARDALGRFKRPRRAA